MRGVFVTGTDTGVGKTLVAACLVRRWHADYWKPAQTGLAAEPGDTETIAHLAAAANRLHKPRFAFQAPLSPEAAASREHIAIRLADFALPIATAPLVVEGAGGVLVPLGGGSTMADLMRALDLPVLLVARTTLGTINHTLLSLEALRARDIPLLGVVFSGAANAGNRNAIERHGAVRVIAELPLLDRLTPETIATASQAFPPLPIDG